MNLKRLKNVEELVLFFFVFLKFTWSDKGERKAEEEKQNEWVWKKERERVCEYGGEMEKDSY